MRKKVFLILLLAGFIFPWRVLAEAGLSEAVRTVYYKVSNEWAASVLPGGEGGGGQDLVTFFKYQKNPKRNLLNSLCVGKYVQVGFSTTFDDPELLPFLPKDDKGNVVNLDHYFLDHNYSHLDIDDTQVFGCFMFGYMAVILGLPLLGLVGGIWLLVHTWRKRRKRVK